MASVSLSVSVFLTSRIFKYWEVNPRLCVQSQVCKVPRRLKCALWGCFPSWLWEASRRPAREGTGRAGRRLPPLPQHCTRRSERPFCRRKTGHCTPALFVTQITEADDVPTQGGVCFLSPPCLFFFPLLVSTSLTVELNAPFEYSRHGFQTFHSHCLPSRNYPSCYF